MNLNNAAHAGQSLLRSGNALLLLGAVCLGPLGGHAQTRLENEHYRLELGEDGSGDLHLASEAKPIRFRPSFTVFFAEGDPMLQNRPAGIPSVSYNVVTWKVAQDKPSPGAGLTVVKRGVAQSGDGFDDRILQGDTAGRTANVWNAARSTELVASAAKVEDGVIRWQFPEHPSFQLEATLTLPSGRAEPVLRYSLRVNRAGFYAIAYTGAPATPLEDAAEIWQPLIWQEKRFPDQPYLTLAHRCPLPGAMVTREGITWSVVADPAEFPFDPLPMLENSRFGIAVRNAKGDAQPILVAPGEIFLHRPIV